METPKEQAFNALVTTIEKMGYPKEFGIVIGTSLGTEKQISRMVSYLVRFQPSSAEEIADEMLAIQAEFERYKDKKIAEYYNMKNNELLNSGPLTEDDGAENNGTEGNRAEKNGTEDDGTKNETENNK